MKNLKSQQTRPIIMLIFKQGRKALDANAKMVIRSHAKKNKRLYSMPVKLDKEVYGKQLDGRKIPINTLGKYLFGVPGWQGHLNVSINNDGNIELLLFIGIPEVLELLNFATDRFGMELLSVVEMERVGNDIYGLVLVYSDYFVNLEDTDTGNRRHCCRAYNGNCKNITRWME